MALAASGTVTLELGLAGVPTVIAYRVALFEELIARALVKTDTIGLANLILGEKIMPELLQRNATAQNLADALVPLIGDTPQRRRQSEGLARLDAVMEVGVAVPSARPPPSCSPWPAAPARFHRRIRRANRNPKGIASAT